MAKTPQDQVNWPYPPNYYPQPPNYNIPYSPQGTLYLENCWRRPQTSMAYAHIMEPMQHSVPYQSSQNNSNVRYSAAQSSSQGRSFFPVNHYLQQQEENRPHLQAGVHRPIPQPNYDYSDFYRYGTSSDNNHQQGFQPTAFKPNVSVYGAASTSPAVEQFPSCSQYSPAQPEPPVPSLDVRQFLSTWQDKDEDVVETDQQLKPKAPPTPKPEAFKPLDYTTRNEPSTSGYGYKQNPAAASSAYYGKPVPELQPMARNVFKQPPYAPESSFQPAPDSSCNQFNKLPTNLQPTGLEGSQHQFGGYERRIEKVFNQHAYKAVNSSPSPVQMVCSDRNGNLVDTKSVQLSEKSLYHLSASLESEDLFDDINRKGEERQRTFAYPPGYQTTLARRFSEFVLSKSSSRKVGVVTTEAARSEYSMNRFSPNGELGAVVGGTKKLEIEPVDKFGQKVKKTKENHFPNFAIADPILNCSTRDQVEQSRVVSPCDSNMELVVDDSNLCIPENLTQPDSFGSETAPPAYPAEINDYQTGNSCAYCPTTSLTTPIDCSLQKSETDKEPISSMKPENIGNISTDSSQSLVVNGNGSMNTAHTVPNSHCESEPSNAQPSDVLENAFEKSLNDENGNISTMVSVNEPEVVTQKMSDESSSVVPPQLSAATLMESPSSETSLKVKLPKRNRTFSLLMFWRYRNRLFPKSTRRSSARTLKTKRRKPRKSRRLAELTDSWKSNIGEISCLDKGQGQEWHFDNGDYVDPAEPSPMSNLTDDSSHIEQRATALAPESLYSLPSVSTNDLDEPSFHSSESPESPPLEAQQEELPSHEDAPSLEVAGSSEDTVLQGIINWPYQQEEITSVNEKESIKVSLPWKKIFKYPSESSNDESLDIGPARVELRFATSAFESQSEHSNPTNARNNCSIFSVKNVIVKNRTVERLPKMVIKKTGGKKYKSYLKDTKLRVVSIKNNNKAGPAEVIIEADHSLEDARQILESSNEGTSNSSTEIQEGPLDITRPTIEKELHHCLLCFATFKTLDQLHTHEKSAIHRHVDILQRSVLHKLQNSSKGLEVPPFRPLSTSEIDYLKWKPSFPGFNHFYYNVPL